MKRVILTGMFGLGCLLSLSACVVPVQPGRPVAVAPVYAPGPVIVDRPVVVGRRGYYRRGYYRRGFHAKRRPVRRFRQFP